MVVMSLPSCHQEKKSHESIYVGEERYVSVNYDNSSDTLIDSASLILVEVELIELYRYSIWKPDVEDTYYLEVNANKSVRKDTVEGSQWILPSKKWKVTFNEEGLFI